MFEDGLGDLDVARRDGLKNSLMDVVLAGAVQQYLHDLRTAGEMSAVMVRYENHMNLSCLGLGSVT